MPSKVKRSEGQKGKPTCPADIAKTILHFGRFKEGLSYMIDYLTTPISSTLILRGNLSTGKKCLLKEAFEACDVTTVYLNPFHYHDDHFALKRLIEELNLQCHRPTIEDLIKSIELRSKKDSRKIVIVLLNFEEFCRQKQSLLYNLTTLTQHGQNVCLIGLTHSLACLSGLEKRVRSRVNAQFYNLGYPYKTFEEYVEFASQLVGGHQFAARGMDQLRWMYTTGNYEISILKRFVVSICSWNEKTGVLTVCSSTMPSEVYSLKSGIGLNIEQIKSFGPIQLDILKLAVFYCTVKDTIEFSFDELRDYAKQIDYRKFEGPNQLTKRDIEPLESTFIKVLKPSDAFTFKTTFVLNIIPQTFRYIIEKNPELQSMRTDSFWKQLPKLSEKDIPAAKRKSMAKTISDGGFTIM